MIDRLIWYQFGANGVLDQVVSPKEFSMILSNLFTSLNREIQVPQLNKEYSEKKSELIPDHLSVCLPTGEEYFLTRLEYRLLEFLKEKGHAGSTYEEIYQFLWKGNGACRPYQIANLVCHIRKKIEQDSNKPRYIKTIRTIGYRLERF